MLFNIERYSNDTEKVDQNNSRQTFLDRIEQRKKDRGLLTTGSVNNDKKSAKKRELQEPQGEESLCDENTADRKRKKKVTRHDSKSSTTEKKKNKFVKSKQSDEDESTTIEVIKPSSVKVVENSFDIEGVSKDCVQTEVLTKTTKKKNKKLEEHIQGEKGLKTQDVTVDVEAINISDEKSIPQDEMFPVLGKQKYAKKERVKRDLPRWLVECHLISSDVHENKVDIEALTYLSQNTIQNLKKGNITHLFPVQAVVIPQVILQQNNSAGFPARDICVQAPTGSGKTLAYALPIIESLTKKIVRQLYCLVVLPSKDLALQVKNVIQHYCQGTNLRVVLLSGVKTFAKEQEKLISKGSLGYRCNADIVVCTPGRLVDHLKQTEGFSLQHLKFLIVDEADRLLAQEYSSWLPLVLKDEPSLYPCSVSSLQSCRFKIQKLLFSATLTHDPEKLNPLHLYNPLLFACQTEGASGAEVDDAGNNNNDDEARFVVPQDLVEKLVIVNSSEKPLVLLHLMLKLDYKRVLCFVKSKEAAHRLYLLLKSMKKFNAAEFSSNLSETQRKGIIRDFKNGNIDLLVASDAMARGMHIEDVQLVVNYDAATNAKTYVHRVGRTARAGMKGEAMTILTHKEVFHFKRMRKKLSSGSEKIIKLYISKSDISAHEEEYEKALSELQITIAEEKKKYSAGHHK